VLGWDRTSGAADAAGAGPLGVGALLAAVSPGVDGVAAAAASPWELPAPPRSAGAGAGSTSRASVGFGECCACTAGAALESLSAEGFAVVALGGSAGATSSRDVSV
jgi:hypothetical protein